MGQIAGREIRRDIPVDAVDRVVDPGSTLLFGSEVKSFLLQPQFEFEIDTDAVDEYLRFRYLCNNRTLIKNVMQLPPGHWRLVGRDSDRVRKFGILHSSVYTFSKVRQPILECKQVSIVVALIATRYSINKL